ncbi:hypothetical protein INT45_004141 [Circinella minor]|uniref:Mitogen-activated protein kinase n=1 Tax=Circinella minor TaxID=1195481 RepID=A0A8H7VHC0_9FUNG|nr:hypothetical protein INT45_004141 [Circinella minor]
MTIADTHYAVELEGGRELFTIERNYKIIRKVGSGSYGTVCSAIELDSNEVVAIKKCFRIFDKKLITKRCLREIKLLQHFNGHPRIINLRAMDIVDYNNFNEVYLIQDCCDTTMADIIHSRLQLEPVHYQWFMYQIFTGLKFIHSANVLHRDLKPANILVNQNCDLRICDFGMARGYSKVSAQLEGMHMTHYVVTRWYRAPEIMMSNNTYDKSIDLWSVGCIFAELLGRKVLFKGTDYVDQLHKIVGILGLPEDTSFWDETTSQSVIEYIKNLRDGDGQPPPKEPIDFSAQFPTCTPEGIDLLKQLLHLDPAKRITADEGLEHPFVEQMRDPGEEIDSAETFDFESFEYIQDEHELRRHIIEEVLRSKGCKEQFRQSSLRVPSASSTMDSLMSTTGDHYDSTVVGSGPRRRYTGSSISTPISQSAAEAHMNAVAAVQEGRDIAVQDTATGQGMIVESDRFVGEPEDMDEEDFKLMDSDDSIRVEYRRRLVGPSNMDVQALERHLSRDW